MGVTYNDMKQLSEGADQIAKSAGDAFNHARNQRAAQDHELLKLLKGQQISRENQENNILRAKQLRDELNNSGGGKNTRYSVGLSPEGGVNISESEAQPMSLATLLGAQSRQDNLVKDVSHDLDKQGVPETSSALEGVNKSWQGGKSVTPLLNALPESIQGAAANLKSRAGEFLGKDDWKGAGEEFQSIKRLMNIDTRNMSGQAVSKHEAGRQMVEKGMALGGNPEMVRQGIEMMRGALGENVANIEAGYPKAVTDTYAGRRGVTSLRDLIPPALPQGQTNDDMVKVINPNGQAGRIPKSKLQGAIKSGYKLTE